jgi:hypothetical protein
MNSREKAVNAFTWGVLTIGGIATAALVAGPMQEHHAGMQNAVSESVEQHEETLYLRERAIMAGAIVLALPGIWKLVDSEEPERRAYN